LSQSPSKEGTKSINDKSSFHKKRSSMNVVAPSSDLQKSIKTKNKGRETIMDENLKTEGNEKLSKMLNSEE
jgi:hypothetical protein